jgi:hypothetical protein
MDKKHRRMLIRAALLIGCRRERLELDGSPSAEEILELTTQERRLEYEMKRLNEGGVAVFRDREVQLGRLGIQAIRKFTQAEDWEEELREQQLASCWRAGSRKRAVASASAGTGAAPSAGEAAAPGAGEAASARAGEAALAGSRSGSISSSSSIAVRVIGPWPRSRRHRRRSTPRQFEPASSSRTPRPGIGAVPRAEKPCSRRLRRLKQA